MRNLRNLLAQHLQDRQDAYKKAIDGFKNAGIEIDINLEPYEGEEDRVEYETNEGELTIRVMGIFDWFWGVDVEKIIKRMDEENPSRIRILLTSPGGLIADGLALYADLRGRAAEGVEIVTEARGIVASAAAIVYLAGDERRMVTGSMLMFHEIQSYFGNREETEKFMQGILLDMEAANQNLDEIYAARLPDIDMAMFQEWVANEQLITAGTAAENGFGEIVDVTAPSPVVNTEPTQEMRNKADRILMNMRNYGLGAVA